VILLDIVI